MTPPEPPMSDAPNTPTATPPRRPGRGDDPLLHDQRRARRPSGAAPLRRSSDDRVVAGIAGGIAAFTGAPVRAVRAVWLVSVPLSIGITALGYLLLWPLIPAESARAG